MKSAVGFAATLVAITLVFIAAGAMKIGALAAPAEQRPVFAVAVSQCGGTIGLYVVIDETHAVLFRGQDTVTFTVKGDEIEEKTGDVTPIEIAHQLAARAKIQQHIVARCPADSAI